MGPLVDQIPLNKHTPNFSNLMKYERFFDGLDQNLAAQHLNFLGPNHLSLKSQILQNHQESALPFMQDLLGEVRDWDQQKQLQYLDFKIYMSEDCLVKVDRTSSFNSLEVRPPYLDVDLVEYVFSLPSHYKLKGFSFKYLQKAVAADFLPDEIINRPKKGFGIPVNKWLGHELKPMLADQLNPGKLKKQGIFRPDFIHTLITEHENQIHDHRMVLWNLLIFQLWYDQWFA